MIETAEELLERLATEGGIVVSTAACSPRVIAEARAEGRMHVNRQGLGFVMMTAVNWEHVCLACRKGEGSSSSRSESK